MSNANYSPSGHETRWKITTLNDDGKTNDYAAWVAVAAAELRGYDLWKYIEGDESVAPPIPDLIPTQKITGVGQTDNQQQVFIVQGNEAAVLAAKATWEPWTKGDDKAKLLILKAIPTRKIPLVKHAKTAKETWAALRDDYLPVNLMRASLLHQRMMGFACKPGWSVSTWVEKMRDLHTKLTDQDPRRMTDVELAQSIVNLLPVDDAWRTFTRTLREDMILLIKTAETQRAANVPEDQIVQPMSSSMVIQRVREEDENQHANDPETVAEIYGLEELIGNKRAAPIINAVTHSQPAKRPRVDKSTLHCSNVHCAKPEKHTIEDCFTYGGKRAGQYPDWWLGRRDLHLHPNERSSETKRKASGNRVQANVNTINFDDQISANAALSQEGPVYSFLTLSDGPVPVKCNNAALDGIHNRRNRFMFYHDTGANRHIVFDRALFTTIRKLRRSVLRVLTLSS